MNMLIKEIIYVFLLMFWRLNVSDGWNSKDIPCSFLRILLALL